MSIWERLAVTAAMVCASLLTGLAMLATGILKHTTMLDVVDGALMLGLGYLLGLAYANDRAKAMEPKRHPEFLRRVRLRRVKPLNQLET